MRAPCVLPIIWWAPYRIICVRLNADSALQSSQHHDNQAFNSALPPLQVCAPPFPLGAEGRLSLEVRDPSLKIRQVQVMIRHGSRSPEITSHAITRFRHNCSHMPEDLQSIINRWNDLFPILSSPQEGHAPLPNRPFFEFETVESGLCTAGQLTPQGIKQHVMKGRAFARAYHSILSQISPKQVYIHSTNLARTRASAAALMSGLLPCLHCAPGPYPIHQYNSEISPSMTYRQCERASRARKNILKLWRALPECQRMPEKLEAVGVNTTFFSEMVDTILMDSCVSNKLHCLTSAPNTCITADLMEYLIDCDNAMWRSLYTDAPDHTLSAYPFLKKILLAASNKREDAKRIKFILHSDHDSGIMAVAGALGFSDGMRPRLASHIVFEFWEDKDAHEFVRVVYNGYLVTKRISGCENELCSMQKFEQAIDNLVTRHGAQPRDRGAFEQVCNMTSQSKPTNTNAS